MTRTDEPSGNSTPAILERELGLIRDAVALVASGATPRVILGGLRFGDALLDSAREIAAAAGARIVPLWTADESGLDITVERLADG